MCGVDNADIVSGGSRRDSVARPVQLFSLLLIMSVFARAKISNNNNNDDDDDINNNHLRPLCTSIFVSRNPLKNWRILSKQIFTDRMPTLSMTSSLGLSRVSMYALLCC